MSRIQGAFAAAKANGRPAFIPFLMGGDPDPSLTVPLCAALRRAGSDIIELGVPFSDPVADGLTIQRSSQRALGRGMGLAAVLDLAVRVREEVACPLVLFTYYNPVLKMGEAEFARRASEAGADGVLVTDLPLEEGAGLRALLAERGIDPILLVAPTSGEERIALASREARGFIYYVSRTGVTGARGRLPEGLAAELSALRQAASVPVAVGFGISHPDQVRSLAGVADGVVVGSALIDVIERSLGGGPTVGSPGPPIDLPERLEQAAARLFSVP